MKRAWDGAVEIRSDLTARERWRRNVWTKAAFSERPLEDTALSRKHPEPGHLGTARPSPSRIPAAEYRPSPNLAPVVGRLAIRLADVRTGFLRYAVAGGAIVGAIITLVVPTDYPVTRSSFELVFVVGTSAGAVVTVVVGWVTFRFLERVLAAHDPPAPTIGPIAVGMALPFYALAGLLASLASLVLMGRTVVFQEAIGGLVAALAYGGAIVLGVGFTFGLRDSARPTTLATVIEDEIAMLENPPGSSRTFWAFFFGATWFIVGFIPVVGLVVLAQTIDGAGFNRLGEEFGGLIAAAIVALWLICGVVGWKISMRLLLGRPEKGPEVDASVPAKGGFWWFVLLAVAVALADQWLLHELNGVLCLPVTLVLWLITRGSVKAEIWRRLGMAPPIGR